MMNKETKNIIKHIKGNARNMAGGGYKNLRQTLMINLTGGKIAKKNCGIYAVDKKLCELAGLKNFKGCYAEKNDALLTWAAKL